VFFSSIDFSCSDRPVIQGKFCLHPLHVHLHNNIRTELKEIEDQKQRALNLIIVNVPESKSENSL
jgi:hypothetical protein